LKQQPTSAELDALAREEAEAVLAESGGWESREARIKAATRTKEAADRKWRAAILVDGAAFNHRYLASLAGTSPSTIWRMQKDDLAARQLRASE